MASTPFTGGGFGHFYAYAPVKIEYAIERFAMETKRQLDVLNRQLADREYILGDTYSLADIAIWPWYGTLVLGQAYDAGEFLAVAEYENLRRWAEAIGERPAAIRGRKVNRTTGDLADPLHARKDASDFL